MKAKLKIKIRGLNYKESLIMIRDARVGGLNYPQIAERLGLDAEAVFMAHIELMNQKLLAWKPETIEREIETYDKKDEIYDKSIVHETIAVWYVPDQPEKKHRMQWKFNFKLKRNRGQTKNEVASNVKKK